MAIISGNSEYMAQGDEEVLAATALQNGVPVVVVALLRVIPGSVGCLC